MPVLKTSQLLRIDIHRTVVDNGTNIVANGFKLNLSAEKIGAEYRLLLTVNGVFQEKYWLLSSQPVMGRLRNGGCIPWDKAEKWFVVGTTNKRFKYLYIHPATCEIGTYADFDARFPYNCLSDKQREQYRQALDIKRGKPRPTQAQLLQKQYRPRKSDAQLVDEVKRDIYFAKLEERDRRIREGLNRESDS